MTQFNDRGPFKVGELVRVVHSNRTPQHIGKEFVIKSPAERMKDVTGYVWIGYSSPFKGCFGGYFAPSEDQLRRVRPPESFTGLQKVLSWFKQHQKEIENV